MAPPIRKTEGTGDKDYLKGEKLVASGTFEFPPIIITRNMEPHTNLTNEITGAYYEEKYTWKDYLYIVPSVALLTALIIRSMF